MAKLIEKQGETSVLLVKGFTYIRECAFLVLDHNGVNFRVILGTKFEFPISDLMTIKGHDLELSYQGIRKTSSGEYPNVYIECIM